MRILFFIYGGGLENGGHYYSLNQISQKIAEKYPVGIVSIGPVAGNILNDNPHFLGHIGIKNLYDLWRSRQRINRIINDFAPTTLHFFDTESFNRILAVNSLRKFSVVMNKCGGVSPRRLKWQQVDDIILFSRENLEWFHANPFYDTTRIHLIPNRVKKVDLSSNQRDQSRKERNTINFIRISRLGNAYEKTLLDSVKLIERLSKQFDVKLIVIGRIQNQARFEELRDEIISKSLPVEFITDDRARIASNLLYLADYVIGTGRSLMEALSLGIPVLTPASNSDIPILVDTENFLSLFRTNFSERNSPTDGVVNKNYSEIQRLLADEDAYRKRSAEMLSFFSKYFDIENVVEQYSKVYHHGISFKRKKSLRIANYPYLFNLLRTMKFFGSR